MNDLICLNEDFSTTRLLSKSIPVVQETEVMKTKLFWTREESIFLDGGLRKQGYYKKTNIGKPLISIITVVFNGEHFLEETIKSIVSQTYDNVEYIVIDGGSKDGTLDIIKKYNDKIDYWISEPDQGMYDALNKGLSLCTGEIINFCNSDDVFYSNDILKTISNNYVDEKFDCCYGSGVFIDEKGALLSYHYVLNYQERYLITLGSFFIQPTFFWTQNIMHKVGCFDLEYKIVSDRDFISRVCMASNKVFKINEFIVKFRKFGDSFGDNNEMIAREETNIITNKLQSKYAINNIQFKLIKLFDRAFQKCYRIYKNISIH